MDNDLDFELPGTMIIVMENGIVEPYFFTDGRKACLFIPPHKDVADITRGKLYQALFNIVFYLKSVAN